MTVEKRPITVKEFLELYKEQEYTIYIHRNGITSMPYQNLGDKISLIKEYGDCLIKEAIVKPYKQQIDITTYTATDIVHAAIMIHNHCKGRHCKSCIFWLNNKIRCLFGQGNNIPCGWDIKELIQNDLQKGGERNE